MYTVFLKRDYKCFRSAKYYLEKKKEKATDLNHFREQNTSRRARVSWRCPEGFLLPDHQTPNTKRGKAPRGRCLRQVSSKILHETFLASLLFDGKLAVSRICIQHSVCSWLAPCCNWRRQGDVSWTWWMSKLQNVSVNFLHLACLS